jgi:hypothetical protein
LLLIKLLLCLTLRLEMVFFVCKAWPFDERPISRIPWWVDKQNPMGPFTTLAV